MTRFKLAILMGIVLLLAGCKSSVNFEPVEVKYDRDMCKRCVMAVSDRLHSAQVVDPKTGEHFFFDDMGCALLWLEEQNFDWKDDAIVYFTDGNDGSWIDGKKAVLAREFITPMSFGIAAFKDKNSVPEGKEFVTYEQAKEIFLAIKAERVKNKEHGKMHQQNKGNME